MDKFRFLIGDVNYRQFGGKWYRKIDNTRYHIIELINMWDATGEENQSQYNVSLSEIDLMNLSEKQIKDCIDSCGWLNDDNLSELVVIESIHSYRIYAPMGNWDSNNYKELLKQAREESHLLDDSDYHMNQMNRSVNQLGSTAYEYSMGDFQSAMIRGIASGDKSAKIIGKIHGLLEEDQKQITDDYKDFSLSGKYQD